MGYGGWHKRPIWCFLLPQCLWYNLTPCCRDRVPSWTCRLDKAWRWRGEGISRRPGYSRGCRPTHSELGREMLGSCWEGPTVSPALSSSFLLPILFPWGWGLCHSLRRQVSFCIPFWFRTIYFWLRILWKGQDCLYFLCKTLEDLQNTDVHSLTKLRCHR